MNTNVWTVKKTGDQWLPPISQGTKIDTKGPIPLTATKKVFRKVTHYALPDSRRGDRTEGLLRGN